MHIVPLQARLSGPLPGSEIRRGEPCGRAKNFENQKFLRKLSMMKKKNVKRQTRRLHRLRHASYGPVSGF